MLLLRKDEYYNPAFAESFFNADGLEIDKSFMKNMPGNFYFK